MGSHEVRGDPGTTVAHLDTRVVGFLSAILAAASEFIHLGYSAASTSWTLVLPRKSTPTPPWGPGPRRGRQGGPLPPLISSPDSLQPWPRLLKGATALLATQPSSSTKNANKCQPFAQTVARSLHLRFPSTESYSSTGSCTSKTSPRSPLWRRPQGPPPDDPFGPRSTDSTPDDHGPPRDYKTQAAGDARFCPDPSPSRYRLRRLCKGIPTLLDPLSDRRQDQTTKTAPFWSRDRKPSPWPKGSLSSRESSRMTP